MNPVDVIPFVSVLPFPLLSPTCVTTELAFEVMVDGSAASIQNTQFDIWRGLKDVVAASEFLIK